MQKTVLQNDVPQRNYGLDVLKIIATVFIFFHHYQQDLDIYYTDGTNFWGGSWFYWGYLVELFFMISGFLMYRYIPSISKGRISLADWYIKRTVRLVPLLALSVVAYEALLYIHESDCDACVMCFGNSVSLWATIITSLGLHSGGAFPMTWVNSPTWYIGVLIIVYVDFYIITVVSQKLKCPLIYTYILMILLGCSMITTGVRFPFFDEDIGRGYCCFFLGLILAAYVEHHGVPTKTGVISLAVSAGFLYLCLFHANPMVEDIRYLLVFVFYPSLIVFTESGISRKLFRHRFWGVWSQCSFNAYIWHDVLLFALIIASEYADISSYLSQRKTMYLACIITQIIGVISHFLIEKPLDRWLKKATVKLTGINNWISPI